MASKQERNLIEMQMSLLFIVDHRERHKLSRGNAMRKHGLLGKERMGRLSWQVLVYNEKVKESDHRHVVVLF